MSRENSIYLIGKYGGWRDGIIDKLDSSYRINDPRDHAQSSIAELVVEDMEAACESDIAFVYVPRGERAGTMSYAELGGARASGKCIVSVDENEKKDSLIGQITPYIFNSTENAIGFLDSKDFSKKYLGTSFNDRTSSNEDYRGVMFTGDFWETKAEDVARKFLREKSVYLGERPEEIIETARDVDLMVVNFEKGWDRIGLFAMGVAYASGIPIVEVEGNSVPYPPLLGLSRRVLMGERRFDQLECYLDKLGSQHITKEALIFYDLMKKFG